ncbi:hypothetical protein NDU88_006115, partial [Pleurodeles waltl]
MGKHCLKPICFLSNPERNSIMPGVFFIHESLYSYWVYPKHSQMCLKSLSSLTGAVLEVCITTCIKCLFSLIRLLYDGRRSAGAKFCVFGYGVKTVKTGHVTQSLLREPNLMSSTVCG